MVLVAGKSRQAPSLEGKEPEFSRENPGVAVGQLPQKAQKKQREEVPAMHPHK